MSTFYTDTNRSEEHTRTLGFEWKAWLYAAREWWISVIPNNFEKSVLRNCPTSRTVIAWKPIHLSKFELASNWIFLIGRVFSCTLSFSSNVPSHLPNLLRASGSVTFLGHLIFISSELQGCYKIYLGCDSVGSDTEPRLSIWKIQSFTLLYPNLSHCL